MPILATPSPRRLPQDEPQPALAYWGTGSAGIAFMLLVCVLAGLRF